MNDPAAAPDLRQGECSVILPESPDAAIYFIGIARTPWTERGSCPRRGDSVAGPLCRLEVHEHWRGALEGIDAHATLDVLYWMHLARRDLVRQNPKRRGDLFGTFALRSPVRPNPIAVSAVALIAVEPAALVVRGLDCVDGTPLVDIKPSRCPV